MLINTVLQNPKSGPPLGHGAPSGPRHRSLFVYHLHMGGPNADALEWQALLSPRYAPRLRQLGVTLVHSAADADVVVVTGLLLTRNLDIVLAQLALTPSPSLLIAVGDMAINGGDWAARVPSSPEGPKEYRVPSDPLLSTHESPLSPHPLSHYADVSISVPGTPVSPLSLLATLAAAPSLLSRPGDRLPQWPVSGDQ